MASCGTPTRTTLVMAPATFPKMTRTAQSILDAFWLAKSACDPSPCDVVEKDDENLEDVREDQLLQTLVLLQKVHKTKAFLLLK